MSSANLFIELEKYKPGRKITPLENFTTTGLMICLKENNNFAKRFVNLITQESKENEKYRSPFKIYNQYKIKTSKIDLIIVDSRNKKIIIEIKTGSRLNKYEDELGSYDQIEKYCRLNNGEVILLTDFYQDIENENSKRYIGQYFWYQVYDLLENYNNFLLIDFKNFLEVKGMGSNDGFTKNLIKGSSNFFDLKNVMEATLKRLFNELISKDQLKSYKLEKRNGIHFPDWKAYEFTIEQRKKNWKTLQAHIGIGIFPNKTDIIFSVDFRMNPKYLDYFAEDNDFLKISKKLKNKEWEITLCENQTWDYFSKVFDLADLKKGLEIQIQELLQFTKQAIKDLEPLINYINNLKINLE